jgi:branched-subunit amino acid transport protein
MSWDVSLCCFIRSSGVGFSKKAGMLLTVPDASYSVISDNIFSPVDFGVAFLFYSGVATMTALFVSTVLASTLATKDIISSMFLLSKAIRTTPACSSASTAWLALSPAPSLFFLRQVLALWPNFLQ